MDRIAVVGAGPAGLVAARYLKSEGFDPVIFEQGTTLGGQWSADPHYSGVWPSMRTNTSRVMTAFSDLAHDAGSPVYPTHRNMLAYLQNYAEHAGLTSSIRLRTPVEEIKPAGRRWTVRAGGREEQFSRVVVATGRYNSPRIVPVPGLESFRGSGGVAHTFGYKHPEAYRGKRVLMAGAAISALEIASDLAMLGAERVAVTQRRQRYVLFKLLAGVPTDHVALTRFGALAAETFPAAAVSRGLKEFIVSSFGSPEQFGAPRPADDVFAAGITLCQHYLPLVAEGRIAVKPWIRSIQGQRVEFEDGSSEEFDAIIFGTGYDLRLPFLSEDVRRTLDVDRQHIDLDRMTFHPDLPGLAFAGLFEQAGPYFTVLELQARWIAYAWSGANPAISEQQMRAGVAAYRARRNVPQGTMAHLNAILFARAAGVEPDPARWPALARALLFGPLSSVSFRLEGHDALPDAAERCAQEAAMFGAIVNPEFSPAEAAQLRDLAKARNDGGLAALVENRAVSAPAP